MSYPSEEVPSVYSTVPADWAKRHPNRNIKPGCEIRLVGLRGGQTPEHGVMTQSNEDDEEMNSAFLLAL